MRIGVGADQRRSDHNERIRDRQRQGPRERRPRLLADDDADKIGVEYRSNDYGGISGVGEIEHHPTPHFAVTNPVTQMA